MKTMMLCVMLSALSGCTASSQKAYERGYRVGVIKGLDSNGHLLGTYEKEATRLRGELFRCQHADGLKPLCK